MTNSPKVDSMVAPAAAPAVRRQWAAVTIADGLMVLIGLLAVWLRFGELARLPLSPAEALAALGNWQFWTTSALDTAITSPAYFAFTNLIMGIGGSGDIAARFVPAVFGVLTVLMPWMWRGRARPAVWLVAGLFMAVSPLLTAVSRTAGGDAIALFALLLMVVAGLDIEVGGRGRSIALGAGLGLGLTASPLFYTGLFALLPAAWVVGVRRGMLSGRQIRLITAGAAITFTVVASSLFLYPAGIGAALRLFTAWLGQFGFQPAGSTHAGGFFDPLLALMRYEPALFVLGLPAIAWAVLRGNRRSIGLSVWLGLIVVLMSLQPAVLTNAAVALLPGYLLVGVLAAAIFGQKNTRRVDGQRARGPAAWTTALGLLGLGALVLVVFGRFARLNLLTGQNATLITLAALAFILAGVAVVLAMAWESPAARRGAFVGLALLTIFWQWGSAWQLSRLGANDPRELWVAAGTDDDVRVMTDLLVRVSRQTANSDRDLLIFSQVDSPVLRWYLRDFTGYHAGAAVPLEAQADVVIAPAAVEPTLPNDYFGADFGLAQSELPAVEPATPTTVLKWLLFRESTAPVDVERVVVWIRSSLLSE